MPADTPSANRTALSVNAYKMFIDEETSLSSAFNSQIVCVEKVAIIEMLFCSLWRISDVNLVSPAEVYRRSSA